MPTSYAERLARRLRAVVANLYTLDTPFARTVFYVCIPAAVAVWCQLTLWELWPLVPATRLAGAAFFLLTGPLLTVAALVVEHRADARIVAAHAHPGEAEKGAPASSAAAAAVFRPRGYFYTRYPPVLVAVLLPLIAAMVVAAQSARDPAWTRDTMASLLFLAPGFSVLALMVPAMAMEARQVFLQAEFERTRGTSAQPAVVLVDEAGQVRSWSSEARVKGYHSAVVLMVGTVAHFGLLRNAADSEVVGLGVLGCVEAAWGAQRANWAKVWNAVAMLGAALAWWAPRWVGVEGFGAAVACAAGAWSVVFALRCWVDV